MKKERVFEGKHVILGVTGSIAAYKACEIVRLLIKGGAEVRVIMTKAARNFVGELTFQTLSRKAVYTDMFCQSYDWEPLHTSLAEWAHLVLIAPASADIIGKLANGIVDELLCGVVFATRAPVLIAPAMNTNMYLHPVLQENICKLKAIGYEVMEAEEGELACGAKGVGRLADVEKIVERAAEMLAEA